MKRIIVLALALWLGSGLTVRASDFGGKLSAAAVTLTKNKVVYDPAYFRIAYPGGDVPANKGVCTDVVIRAYRQLGIDLQQLVHEDMSRHFAVYPKLWGLSRPDPNIDHRRVPNLACFFSRYGQVKAVTNNGADYKPGDMVTWTLSGGRPHIGVVSPFKSVDGQRYQLVHNIGRGQVLEDCLLAYTITGHYAYDGRRKP
jgi:uncharacterized protein YijF (DUF1287 family)